MKNIKNKSKLMNKNISENPITHIPNKYTDQMENKGISRREFIKFCTAIAATLSMPYSFATEIGKSISQARRPTVIWLHFQECTGCTESLLRATHPTVEHLILDLISLDYSETLSVAAGHQAEEALQKSITENEGKFILVVEGSVPLSQNGIFCKIGNRTALDIISEIGPKAAATVAIGSCASWGGVQASAPNPTGATAIGDVYKMVNINTPVINLPGCPASPYNILSTILYYLTLNKLPELDEQGRPKFAYSTLIHDLCERRPHFDSGRFAEVYGDYGHRKGWCLYKIGCKGPETYANCPTIQFGDVGTWPVKTGHPCFGCAEEGVGFTKPLHEHASVFSATPPAAFPGIDETKGIGITPGAAAVAGAAAGIAVGAGAMAAKYLGNKAKDKQELDDDS